MKRLTMAAPSLIGTLLAMGLAGCDLFSPGTSAVISASATGATVPLTVTFDGTESTGTDGISTYHWIFGMEDESHGTSGTYTYQQAGMFTLSLTVRAEDGKTATETVAIRVNPAVWVTDETLDRVYRLSLDGATLGFFDLPAKEPRGVNIATVNGLTTLVIACANEGFQRIIYLDPVTGALLQEKPAPVQSPEEINYGATG
jgi:PKD repeat protein